MFLANGGGVDRDPHVATVRPTAPKSIRKRNGLYTGQKPGQESGQMLTNYFVPVLEEKQDVSPAPPSSMLGVCGAHHALDKNYALSPGLNHP